MTKENNWAEEKAFYERYGVIFQRTYHADRCINNHVYDQWCWTDTPDFNDKYLEFSCYDMEIADLSSNEKSIETVVTQNYYPKPNIEQLFDQYACAILNGAIRAGTTLEQIKNNLASFYDLTQEALRQRKQALADIQKEMKE